MDTFKIDFEERWPTGPEAEAEDRALVGQPDRTWLIPLLHSTLANPEGRHSWPRYDKATGLKHACAYWETAYYLLGVLLGWTDIGIGLQRMYATERPTLESPHLELLQLLWNDRGQLDLFALWAWQRGVRVRAESHAERAPEAFRGRDWYDDVLKRHPGYGVAYDHDPYYGGSNPLHLGHCLGAFDQSAGGELLQGPSSRRRAVLILDGARGWCSALEQVDLPALDDESWRVDVVVRPLGWLGTLRRSRVTGRWFLGKHSVHMLGVG